MTWQAQFGELRQLMQTPTFERAWCQKVTRLLRWAWQEDEAMYRDQWIAYMAAFDKLWDEPLLTLKRLDELATWVEIAPFACFSLNLSRSWTGEHAIKVLESHEGLSSVASFLVNKGGLSDDHVRRLARLEGFERLRWLYLSSNAIGSGGLSALLHSAHLRGVEVLNLEYNEIRDLGAFEVYEGALRELYLGFNRFSTLMPLVQSSCWASLEVLDLRCAIEASDLLPQLAEAPEAPKLHTLHLNMNTFSDEALAHFAQHAKMPNLSTLLIEEYHMSKQTKRLFAQAPGLSERVRRQFH